MTAPPRRGANGRRVGHPDQTPPSKDRPADHPHGWSTARAEVLMTTGPDGAATANLTPPLTTEVALAPADQAARLTARIRTNCQPESGRPWW